MGLVLRLPFDGESVAAANMGETTSLEKREVRQRYSVVVSWLVVGVLLFV
jgi:hypothetical protein